MNMQFIQKITKITFGIAVSSLLLFSCTKDPQSPGYEYMPDMYRSPSYETYGENHAFGLKDSMSARLPVKGTIPINHEIALVDGTNEGYAKSDSLKNPIVFSKEVLESGKDLYTKFCQHCHGAKGDGDGKVVTNGGFPPPPAYATGNSSRGQKMNELSGGKIYHTITYGLNMMGPHASQLSPEDRWKIVYYVQELQKTEKK
jgi:mono/diheme cytochrome c family protein